MFIADHNQTNPDRVVSLNGREWATEKSRVEEPGFPRNAQFHAENAQAYIWNLLKQPLGSKQIWPIVSAAQSDRRLQEEIKHLKQQLQASEDRFRNLIERNADGIAIVDRYGKVCFVNPAAESLFNCRAAEILGQEFFGRLVVERQACEIDNCTIQNFSEPQAAAMRVVQAQVDVKCKGKPPAIAEMRVVETEWEGEIAFQCVLRDVTDRVNALNALQRSEARLREQTQQLEQTLCELKQTQTQLVQSEKMSSLGQLVAGVAHEINNPVNFINGNLYHASKYSQDLLNLLYLYEQHYPNPVSEIQTRREAIDLNFLAEDFPRLMSSMQIGAERIREIVLCLRNFSRLDESDMKPVNLHEGIDSTLSILQGNLKAKHKASEIQIVKEYSQLPLVECYAGQMNQVFMNILSNALDALEDYNKQRSSKEIQAKPSQITIRTEIRDRQKETFSNTHSPLPMTHPQSVVIRIADNGYGMNEEVRARLFDPFFTTKAVGKGTGLGLSIAYQIVVEKHGGVLTCFSQPGQGAEFWIEIPIRRYHPIKPVSEKC